MDERTWSVMESVQRFLDEAVESVRGAGRGDAVLLRTAVQAHLGADPQSLPVVRLDVPPHDFVNLDVAMAALIAEHGGGEVIGVGGGDQRHHATFGDLLAPRGPFGCTVGAVDRSRVETGPDSSHEAVALGVHLFRYRGVPVAALQRRGLPQYGSQNLVELVAADGVTEALLADVRRLMIERSVFRGQVISYATTSSRFHPTEGGVTFQRRPELASADVVLPGDTLTRLERHVVGAVRHRDQLRAAGQHLKRGLLLYGPPGTGKTHTVRYLIGRLHGVTSILLSGNALGLISEATELARALQPSLIVLEDVDLIAEHREFHGGPQPLLFMLLDAMDGLAADADVAFVLTTNRADLLEQALTQRPGRVDLAVEIPLPDDAARRALLGLYTRDLPFSPAALDDAARRSGGVTASFFKELARRTVLHAAEAGEPVSDAVLDRALTEMLSDGETLTRALLGGRAEGGSPPADTQGLQ